MRNVVLGPAEPVARLVYRGPDTGAAASAFGVAFAPEPLRAVVDGTRATLHLGPDEWWLFAPLPDLDTVRDALTAALDGTPHSLVDISDRQVGQILAGPRAAEVLAAFCPLDLDRTPPGTATRTVLGKATILLWRIAPDVFHIETTRSFAPYVTTMLAEEAGFTA